MKGFKTMKRHFIPSLIGIFLLIFPPFYGCKTEDDRTIHTSTVTAIHGPKFTKEGELTFFSKNNREIVTIDIEIADTLEEKRRGLMYRRAMTAIEGMVFVNDMSRHHFFWMKDTYIPLDMIFVGEKMQIVKIERNTIPLSEKLIAVPKDAQYTIEVNAGFCDQHSIKIGDSIQMVKIP
jgi:uncharacterized protein